MCVCRLRHSSDQEVGCVQAILDSGVDADRMLRIGGRSASARIEELNLFNWLNRSMAAAADGGVKSSNMDRAEKQRNYDLRLSVNEAEGELRAAWAELESVRWHRPEEVHLLYVEDDLEVLIA